MSSVASDSRTAVNSGRLTKKPYSLSVTYFDFLSMGPFCVTRSNPTHQLTDPTQPTTSGNIWTRLNPTNNGAYSLVETYFWTQNLSRNFSQPKYQLIHVLCWSLYEYILKTVSLRHSKRSCSKKCLKCPQQQLRKPARSPIAQAQTDESGRLWWCDQLKKSHDRLCFCLLRANRRSSGISRLLRMHAYVESSWI